MYASMARADASTHVRILSLAIMLSIAVIWIAKAAR
jgi:hypothetical protein